MVRILYLILFFHLSCIIFLFAAKPPPLTLIGLYGADDLFKQEVQAVMPLF